MEAFKNRYNQKSVDLLSVQILKYEKDFDRDSFLKKIKPELEKLEMKQRVILIAESLHCFLPSKNYKKNIKVLLKTLSSTKNVEGLDGFILWPYSYYIEKYGIDDFHTSMNALQEITKRFTSEWGIRPFFSKYPDQTYSYLSKLVNHKNDHVRRWISEGTRPNLPWGMKIIHLNKNLKRNISLIENLINDDSLYVRKSIANHMNDMSRIDDKLTLKTLKKWSKINSPNVSWIIKRSLRSLLKQGNAEALALLGFNINSKSKVSFFSLSKNKVKEGESVLLSFTFKNLERSQSKFMIDYSIHYIKKNGEVSVKVFKLRSLELSSLEEIKIEKKISFKKVTTRKHYSGNHKVSLQVNGKVQATVSIDLKVF